MNINIHGFGEFAETTDAVIPLGKTVSCYCLQIHIYIWWWGNFSISKILGTALLLLFPVIIIIFHIAHSVLWQWGQLKQKNVKNNILPLLHFKKIRKAKYVI